MLKKLFNLYTDETLFKGVHPMRAFGSTGQHWCRSNDAITEIEAAEWLADSLREQQRIEDRVIALREILRQIQTNPDNSTENKEGERS